MNDTTTADDPGAVADGKRIRQLLNSTRRRSPMDAVLLLERENDATIVAVLGSLDPELAMRLLHHMSIERSSRLDMEIDATIGRQWSINLGYEEKSVGRLMEPPMPQFLASSRVADVIEELRVYAEDRNFVYAFAIDEDMHLQGIVVMRELMFADPGQTLEEVMVTEPCYFTAATSIEDAMNAVLLRHYPVYPVCDENRVLLGIVHGYALFEKRTHQLTAMAGSMVGVEREEHLTTPWKNSLRLRHPWLQLNLLTALLAGAVVGIFEDTIARVVVLAAFLPVLAGQSGNTGCQALAITLRGMTLNELKPGMGRVQLLKESLLGLCNGILVGLTAAVAMFIYAGLAGAVDQYKLALVVLLAMTGSCIASGLVGVLVPLGLRRYGADPATASTIFVTTATDVVSMGLLLILATLMM